MPNPSRSNAQAVESSAATSTRVLISDDHALVRAGIRALLERIPELELAEAEDEQQTLTCIKTFKPGVILLAVPLGALVGFALLQEIHAKFPASRVLVIAQQASEELAVQALRCGAAGFLTKSASSADLQLAIKTVAENKPYLTAALSLETILKYFNDPRASSSGLTPRQHEVLTLVAEGHATKEIARRLDISVKTVETHRAQIMDRLNIHDVAGLVRYAIRTGLIEA